MGKVDASSSSSQLGPLHLSCTHSVRAHDKDVNTVAVSPNDALMASGSQDKSIRLWRAADLVPVATLNGHKRGVWRVAFSPVDRCIASCSGDRTVRLWSVVDYTCLRVFEGHTASVLTVRFVNKGMQMLSGAADGLIRLWTIRTGECENTFDQHEDRVWAIATAGPGSSESASGSGSEFGDDGTFFSGGTDSKLLVWHDATEEEEQKRLDVAEETLLVEQQLQNDIRNKRYDKVT
jgi:U3 small nucleolar RNA-associated protein 13